MTGKFPKNLLLSNKFMNLFNAGLLAYGLANKDHFDEKNYDVNLSIFKRYIIKNNLLFCK